MMQRLILSIDWFHSGDENYTQICFLYQCLCNIGDANFGALMASTLNFVDINFLLIVKSAKYNECSKNRPIVDFHIC